jgi:putative restriction endonuclease
MPSGLSVPCRRVSRLVAAYWLTFKQKDRTAPRGWPLEELQALVSRFETTPSTATEWWRISSHRSAKPGDRVFIFKQGQGARGIFASGTIVGGPEERESINDNDGLAWRALVLFDQLVDPTKDFLISYEDLQHLVPKELVEAQASGNSVPPEVAEELERMLSRAAHGFGHIDGTRGDDGSFDPASAGQPERAVRAITVRRGQANFRNALLDAYARRCAMTACSVVDVLEAAHITPYMGATTNHVTNGLLLRADLHTLFDCGLLSVEPISRTIVIGAGLVGSTYEALSGRKLRAPKNPSHSPSQRSLKRHFDSFNRRKAGTP